jgi:chromosomal replication initiation ATPase DnaA
VNSRERQLALKLPHRPQMTRSDFLVGAANASALALIESWPAWRVPAVMLSGPPGSGKSHLVEIWRTESNAPVIAAAALDDGAIDRLLDQGAVAVEDLHTAGLNEAALFHLLNLARERSATVLMTSRHSVSALAIALPDLLSRLKAAQPAELGAPDDGLLRAVLVKLFADRQLTVDPDVIDYIVARMERSLEAASILVDYLDREALASSVPVTRRLVSQGLASLFPMPEDRPG